MVTVIMQDEKYASIGQLLKLAQDGKHANMMFLLQNYTYSRYAVSLHRKQLVNNQTPRDIAELIMNYHESALATL